jgi:hypothetical protein
LLTVAVTTVLGACGVVHLNPLAPGHIDVETPPRELANRRAEPPRESGEDITWLNYGVLGCVGPSFHDGSVESAVGPEVSLHVGDSPFDHQSDSDFVAPRRAWGLNLGWATHPTRGAGSLYAEVQRTRAPLWLAGGWAWDPWRHDTGPQVSMGFGPLFVRVTPLLDGGGTLLVGIAIKGGVSWVRSR